MSSPETRPPLDRVCTALAALLDRNRRQVELSLDHMQSSRDPDVTQTTYVHTPTGTVRLTWPPHATRIITTLLIGPIGARIPGLSPSFVGRSLMLRFDAFANLPDTVIAAMPGRLLGEIGHAEDAFIATMSTRRMERIIQHEDHVEIILDVEMKDWV